MGPPRPDPTGPGRPYLGSKLHRVSTEETSRTVNNERG